MKNKKKLWAGRFSENLDDVVLEFTESVSFDKKLALYDIQGSIAHTKMLAHSKIISKNDEKKILSGLRKIEKLIKSDKFKFDKNFEDIHLNIESYLIKLIGDTGKKVHTARSRNDQVLVDIYLYLKTEIKKCINLVNELERSIVKLAEENLEIIIPGYTHLQQAQPILVSHFLLAYFFKFQRDKKRLKNNYESVDVLPLGVGALAGVNYNTDRKFLADLLDFKDISLNSIDTVSNRDFFLEFLFNASLIALHISRLSEDFIIMNTEEFGFITIGDAFTTGSSIMPNKKNPDVFELLRGKSAKIYGNLTAGLTLLKSLPLSYNRDLQEDKKILFESVEYIESMLTILAKVLNNIKFNQNNILKKMSNGYTLATDIADYLVKAGMPFREAHSITGKIVKYCEDNKISLFELSVNDLQKFSKKIKDDIIDILDFKKSVNNKISSGGTSLKSVKNQLRIAKKLINK